jgi:alpha-galactosidase
VITRRDLLRLAAATPLGAIARRVPSAQQGSPFDRNAFTKAPWRVEALGGDRDVKNLRVDRSWNGLVCQSRLTNTGATPIRVREVVLFDLPHGLAPATRLYGEGFQMLTQTGGTIGQPLDLGNYTDPKHYRLPEPAGAKTVYGALTLAPPGDGYHLLAFTSCRRFNGKVHVRATSIEIVIEADGLEIGPGEQWTLEEFTHGSGPDREALLGGLAERLSVNHPPLLTAAPPSGWCSWYCFGPKVTAEQVLANLDVIARDIPGLKYIQIDDGYQPAMGDWLETGAAFGGNVQTVLKQIRARGFEPAIWVAPFIAEQGSQLFKEHPGWFVKDTDGTPLRADKVTFGGWRRGPWYALDGTHPEAQKHLEHVFRTMRTDWGCTYFKLDANFWGAIHGGRFHDPRATRIDAYRRGMEAVRRGAGDAFILGCNHPIWPSLGLIHGSRSSNDIRRDWRRIETTARQNLMRNWQNGRLWWNDPDAVVLTGELPEEEYRFHATAIYATGGMILSGDDLTVISPDRLAMLRQLQPPTGVAARFGDERLHVGVMDLKNRHAVCLLNSQEQPQSLTFTLPRAGRVRELWTREDLGRRERGPMTMALPARSGRVLVVEP